MSPQTVERSPTPRSYFRRLVAAFSLVLVSHPVLAADWPCWRGPAGDGISRESIDAASWPAEGPAIAWRAAVGIGFSSVVVQDDLLYTTGHDDGVDVVHCLSVADGESRWTFEYEAALDDRFFEGGPTATPTIDGDLVYVLSRAGELFCFDRASGEVRWSRQVAETAGVRAPGWGFAGSPVVHRDLLVLNLGEAGAAVHKQTGEIAWSSGDREAGYATPALVSRGDRTVALIAGGKFQLAVDADTGEELWRERWLTNYGCNAATPIAWGDQVFVSSGYNRGCALFQWTDGEPTVVWKHKEMQNQLNTCLLIDGKLYGFHGNEGDAAQLRCLDWATGEVLWSFDGLGCGSLSAAGSDLIVLSETGELVVGPASPDGFEPIARAGVLEGKCWTVPVLSGGRIFCRNAAGDLVCVAAGS